MVNGDGDCHLLRSQRGDRFTRSGIIDLVRRTGRRVLNRDDLTPHWLRRSWATHVAREVRDDDGNVTKPAMPAPRLQREAGWSSLQTAQNYVDAAVEDDEAPVATYVGFAVTSVAPRG